MPELKVYKATLGNCKQCGGYCLRLEEYEGKCLPCAEGRKEKSEKSESENGY